MALEHLEKMSQNDILRERDLAREKNWLAYVLDREGLVQKGREEKQKAIILTMIELNYSLPEIAKVVKCSEDEIKKLIK